MGEFFRDSGIYVDYDGVNKSWVPTWTRFDAQEITDLNETIREYCREYLTKTDSPNAIPRLEQVLPTSWFVRLAKRWSPKK